MTAARLLLALALGACGSTVADGAGSAAVPGGSATAGTAAAGPSVEIPPRPLGLADVAGYGWRTRAGQPAFRTARAAERREDWKAVAAACQKALALDPGHLEAAWLLAAADGALGANDAVLAPLQQAVAGDFGKWGDNSLDLPLLQRWLATPTGEAWRHRLDADRASYAAALARAVIVAAGGELYAVDVDVGADAGAGSPRDAVRWYRLTRTYGGVIAALALPEDHRLAYVTRTRGRAAPRYGVGLVDLSNGHWTRPAEVAGVATFAVEPRAGGGAWLRPAGGPTPAKWLDEDGRLAAAPPHTATTAPTANVASLRVVGRGARLDRRAAEITADFDDRGLASQIRLDPSKRVVSVPSPGQIDGSSIAWAPDRVRLALIAQLEDRCTAGARAAVAAVVVDAATGVQHELERATGGLAVEWIDSGRVAVAGDRGVSIYDLDHPGAAAVAIAGATDLVTPRRVPRCVPVDDEGSGGSGAGSGSGEELELE